MDRSELAKLKQKQGSTTVESNDINIKDVTPTSAVDVDVQDIYIKGVRSGQRVIKDHALLSNLDYIKSGHTGFAGILFGTTAEWNAKGSIYAPPEGMLIVYTDFARIQGQRIPGFKIGIGQVYLCDLPFVGDDIRAALEEHINNPDVHILPGDRERWDNKLNLIEPAEDDMLIFTRD